MVLLTAWPALQVVKAFSALSPGSPLWCCREVPGAESSSTHASWFSESARSSIWGKERFSEIKDGYCNNKILCYISRRCFESLILLV